MYKSYEVSQYGHCTPNPYLQFKTDAILLGNHRYNVKSAKPRIDNAAPPTFAHMYFRPKKLQLEQERYSMIQRNNRYLLDRLATIRAKGGWTENKNYHDIKSLNTWKRQQEMVQLAYSNQSMLARLNDCHSVYQRSKLEDEYLLYQKHKSNISKFPQEEHRRIELEQHLDKVKRNIIKEVFDQRKGLRVKEKKKTRWTELKEAYYAKKAEKEAKEAEQAKERERLAKEERMKASKKWKETQEQLKQSAEEKELAKKEKRETAEALKKEEEKKAAELEKHRREKKMKEQQKKKEDIQKWKDEHKEQESNTKLKEDEERMDEKEKTRREEAKAALEAWHQKKEEEKAEEQARIETEREAKKQEDLKRRKEYAERQKEKRKAKEEAKKAQEEAEEAEKAQKEAKRAQMKAAKLQEKAEKAKRKAEETVRTEVSSAIEAMIDTVIDSDTTEVSSAIEAMIDTVIESDRSAEEESSIPETESDVSEMFEDYDDEPEDLFGDDIKIEDLERFVTRSETLLEQLTDLQKENNSAATEGTIKENTDDEENDDNTDVSSKED